MATLGEIAEVNAVSRDAADERRRQGLEQKRLRQQRRRELKAADAERAAIVEAEKLEHEAAWRDHLGEELAPAILRHPVMSGASRQTGFVRHAGVAEEGAPMIFIPTGRSPPPRMLVGPRVSIIDGRAVRTTDFIIEDLLAPQNRPVQLSDRQKRAIRYLRLDSADLAEGVNSGVVNYLGTGRGGAPYYPDEDKGLLAQIDARARLEGAKAYMGAFTPGIVRVVLDCVPLSVWREEVGKSAEDALAWLRAGLNRLADFYWPPREPGEEGLKLLTFGPSRASYEVAPPDIERKKVTIDDWHGA